MVPREPKITLEVRLQEAASHGLSHVEFLELMVQDELLVRSDRMVQRPVQRSASSCQPCRPAACNRPPHPASLQCRESSGE